MYQVSQPNIRPFMADIYSNPTQNWEEGQPIANSVLSPEVNELIELSDQMLGKSKVQYQKVASGGRPVNIRYVDNSWNWGFGGRRVVHHHHYDNGKKDEKESNNGLVVLAMIVGVAMMAGYSYLVGKSSNRQMRVSERLEKVQEIKRNMQSKMYFNEDLKLVKALAGNSERLAKLQTKRSSVDLALKIAMFAAGVLLVSGGALTLWGGPLAPIGGGLMVAGAIMTLVAGCGLLFKSGFQKNDNEKEQLRGLIQQNIQKLVAIETPLVPNYMGVIPNDSSAWSRYQEAPPPVIQPSVNPASLAPSAPDWSA